MFDIPTLLRCPRMAALLLIPILATAAPAQAQNIGVGLTTDLEDGGLGGVFEFHGAPVFGQPSGLSGSWGVAARGDLGGDAWVGAGFVMNYDISNTTFVEASFMPGYYHAGDTELGGNLQFRSLLGFGYRVSPTGSLILSLDHISNANFESVNPGAETLGLRYRMEF